MPDKALSPSQLRSRIALELHQFAGILVGEGIITDPGPLFGASSGCHNHSGNQWGYSFSGLTLHVGEDVKCIPSFVSRFACRLDVEVEGSAQTTDPRADPLEKHQVQIELKAPNDADPSRSFLQAWHMDRHPDSPGTPKPAHPRYHLSFGGHRLEAHLSAGKTFFEGILLLDSPRLSHPPLDGVLAIDFVLSHFAGTKWRTLFEQPDYRRIIIHSQELLWKPYALALYAHWSHDPASKKIWPIAELWPQVVCG